jgi:hypothetical protein
MLSREAMTSVNSGHGFPNSQLSIRGAFTGRNLHSWQGIASVEYIQNYRDIPRFCSDKGNFIFVYTRNHNFRREAVGGEGQITAY